jgi:N-acetylmuramoyl-L-alanine amidase
MANWILFARDASGKPLVSAMNGANIENSLNSDLKANVIGFLKLFSEASTFLVAQSDDNDRAVEAIDLIPRTDLSTASTSSVQPNGTWFQFFRDRNGQPIVVAMNGTNPIEFYKGNLKSSLIDFLDRHSSANTFQIAPAETSISGSPLEWKPSLPTSPSKHRVMLEIGHGPGVPFDPGAIAHDSVTTEHSLNIIAANAARNAIVKEGINCTVIDTAGSLHSIGLQSSGFDVFCSVHHNSFNGKVQKAEAFSHATKGDGLDSELAGMIATELSKTLNITNGGAKKAKLGVLSGAEDTNVRVAVLAEVYFIDFKGNGTSPKPNLNDYSTRGGEAIGRAIVEWLKKHP